MASQFQRFFQNDSGKKFFLLVVIILAILLRLIFRTGLLNPDSFLYLIGAININEFGLDSYLSNLSLATSRFAITFPLAFILKLFGFSETTFAIFPFTVSILAVIVAFSLGRFTSFRTGLIAALLVAVIPQDVSLATAIIPDAFIPFYTGMALLFLVIGLRKDQIIYYLLSGIFLAFAFQTRTTSLILLPSMILIALMSHHRTWRSLVLPFAGFAATILLIWIFLFISTGDPFIQMNAQSNVVNSELQFNVKDLFRYSRSVFGQINFNFGFLFYLAILALIPGLYFLRRHEKFHLPVVTFLTLFLFWEFGVTLTSNLVGIIKIDRYLTILTIPAALLIAVAFDHLMTRSRRSVNLGLFALLAIQILLAITMILKFGPSISQGSIQTNSIYKRVIQRLDEFDAETVGVVNFRWIIRGTVYAWLEGAEYQFKDLQDLEEEEVLPGTIVIYDPTYFTNYGERREKRNEFPALAGLPESVPLNWQLLFTDQHFIYKQQPVYIYAVFDQALSP